MKPQQALMEIGKDTLKFMISEWIQCSQKDIEILPLTSINELKAIIEFDKNDNRTIVESINLQDLSEAIQMHNLKLRSWSIKVDKDKIVMEILISC